MLLGVRIRVAAREVVHAVAHAVAREVAHAVVHGVHGEARGVDLVVPAADHPDADPDAGAGDLVEKMRGSREELARQEVPEAVFAEDLRGPAAVLPGLATFLMFLRSSLEEDLGTSWACSDFK